MAHLPRLKEMGVEIIWLMPVHPIGFINRKGTLGSYYSIKDFNDVNLEFGTKEDFRNLVTAIHELGMKVIIDWVANHAAWDNVWTETNPDFFIRTETGAFISPYDWDDVIQVDHSNYSQQNAMIAAMEGWVRDYNIDGFRADLAHLTPLEFWKNARKATSRLKKDLIWLAETEEISYHEAFDISFTWEWMHATEALAKGSPRVESLLMILKKYREVFPPQAHRMFFTSNHDENSWNGSAREKYGDFVKALDVMNSTYNSIPLIYNGQEVPVEKRLLFFDKDPIDWSLGLSCQDFYKTLLVLRKRNVAVQSGYDNVGFFESIAADNILGYYRTMENEVVVVLLNFTQSIVPVQIEIADSSLYGTFIDIFSGKQQKIESSLHIILQPAGYVVLEKVK